MAKPKKSVLAKVMSGLIVRVWANDLILEDVLSVEGVVKVIASCELPWWFLIDDRYDPEEVATELEELLSSKVPGVFYNEDSPD